MFFDDLEEIGRAYESKEFMRTVMIKGPYQCGTSVFQLANVFQVANVRVLLWF